MSKVSSLSGKLEGWRVQNRHRQDSPADRNNRRAADHYEGAQQLFHLDKPSQQVYLCV